MEMDLSKQLHAYEVEYHVLQDEVLDGGAVLNDSDHRDKLEKTNVQLKKQNMDLLEKLQVRRKELIKLHVWIKCGAEQFSVFKVPSAHP